MGARGTHRHCRCRLPLSNEAALDAVGLTKAAKEATVSNTAGKHV